MGEGRVSLGGRSRRRVYAALQYDDLRPLPLSGQAGATRHQMPVFTCHVHHGQQSRGMSLEVRMVSMQQGRASPLHACKFRSEGTQPMPPLCTGSAHGRRPSFWPPATGGVTAYGGVIRRGRCFSCSSATPI